MRKVSTIIPVFNRSGMLREAVASVLAQTWRPIEIIIVDDGSTDDTSSVAAEIAQQNPGIVRAVRQNNGGPGVARGTGLQLATGEFVQYLDSDDLLHPRKFEMQVKALEAHPEAGVSYCITLRHDPRLGQMRPWARTEGGIERLFPDFLPKRGWATVTPLWCRRACDQIGSWSNLRLFEDWEHDLRAGMLGIQPVHVNETLCTMRDHDGDRASGMATGYTPPLTREMFRAHEVVWKQMRERGLTEWSYLAHFAKTMFWLARMCGERGLIQEAEQALTYADELFDFHGRPRTLRLFRWMTQMIGWKASVAISERGHTFWSRFTPFPHA